MYQINGSCTDSPLPLLKPDAGWADNMIARISSYPDAKRSAWEALLRHAVTVCPPFPATVWDAGNEAGDPLDPGFQRRCAEILLDKERDASWRDCARSLIRQIGEDTYRADMADWLERVPTSKPGYLSRQSLNREMLRGLLWTTLESIDLAFPRVIGTAANFLFKKSSPLGTTCVAVLARIGTLDALSQLTVLAGRVKASSHRLLIQIARERVAARNGIHLDDLDDLTIPKSGLTELGRRVQSLGGHSAELVVVRNSVELRWFKPNGQQQSGIPATVKREHSGDVAELKHAVKEIETSLAMVSRRLETAPLGQRSWNYAAWKSRYLDHPVAGTLVRRLIWNLSDSEVQTCGVPLSDYFVDVSGRSISVADNTRVSVWHPINADVQVVLAWRDFLFQHAITQPFKQAHREVYLLTDAERTTRVYSNRFAAHVLRQSQFRALAKSRGWRADFLVRWDAGEKGVADLKLPRWNLRAEFWINGAGDERANAAGSVYVATDQVRFYAFDNALDPLPLDAIAPLVFSEVLRDIDLFVGVASVGNDPGWQDGGPDGRYSAYWHDVSFGELTETAQTRKEVLERVIRRLKIADRCHLHGHFLVVKGDLRTYKIHLGSANILMEPNDQYLCIVSDRGLVRSNEGIFLPFEGDRTLSLILSKALLLADDKRITDPTITRQITGSRHG